MAELFALIDNDDVQMVSQWGTLERQSDFMQIENETRGPEGPEALTWSP